MIAITPIPPTISAIDEMTISVSSGGLTDLLPRRSSGVLRDQVEVVRLVERQPVADAHDLFDFRQQPTLLARRPRQMPMMPPKESPSRSGRVTSMLNTI